MKLTELILELHTIMLKEGNLDVTVVGYEPRVTVDEGVVELH
jgi:hypothetical protein